MRILFLGDVVGRAGREAVIAAVPELRTRHKLDVVAVNGENAAHGFGITGPLCRQFYKAGVDVITTGNHAWDQRELISYIDSDPRLLRPANFPDDTPGRGSHLYTLADGRTILVIQVMGRLFMEANDCPFAVSDRILQSYRLGVAATAIVLDIHGEASSEKMALAHHLDGRVSAVVGTHSHIPTADAQVLVGGTAYQTDLGMCGDYDSVIGMAKEAAVARFVRRIPGERLSPAGGEATVCGVLIETDNRSGLATAITPLRMGGRLAPGHLS